MLCHPDHEEGHRNLYSSAVNVVTVIIICLGFWGPPSECTGITLKSYTVPMEMWFGSWRKGLCLPGNEIVKCIVYCTSTLHHLFPLVKSPLTLGDCRWDSAKDCKAHARAFLPLKKVKIGWEHVCTPSSSMSMGMGSQSKRAPGRKDCPAFNKWAVLCWCCK